MKMQADWRTAVALQALFLESCFKERSENLKLWVNTEEWTTHFYPTWLDWTCKATGCTIETQKVKAQGNGKPRPPGGLASRTDNLRN